MDKAAFPLNSTIKDFQKGNTHYLVEALEQPFYLLKDMVALKNMRQPDLFLSLKRDLALVSSSTCLINIMLGYLLLFFSFLFLFLFFIIII